MQPWSCQWPSLPQEEILRIKLRQGNAKPHVKKKLRKFLSVYRIPWINIFIPFKPAWIRFLTFEKEFWHKTSIDISPRNYGRNRFFSGPKGSNTLWFLNAKVKASLSYFTSSNVMMSPYTDSRVTMRTHPYKARPGSYSSPASPPFVRDPASPTPLGWSPWPRPWTSLMPKTQTYFVHHLSLNRLNFNPQFLLALEQMRKLYTGQEITVINDKHSNVLRFGIL